MIRPGYWAPIVLAAGLVQACEASANRSAETTPVNEVQATDDTSPSTATTQVELTIAEPPTRSDGLDWTVRLPSASSSNQTGVLAFELTNTDHQPLHLICERGSGQLSGGGEGLVESSGLVTLESGDQMRVLSATPDVDGPGPYFSFNEILSTSDPLIDAISNHGWVWLTLNGHREGMPASPSGQRAIAEFLAFCG